MFHMERGLESLVPLFLQEENMHAITLQCPWLLRYVAVALILRREPLSHSTMKQLVRALDHEDAAADDPILDFVRSLLGRFDFAGAQDRLRACESVLATDFFFRSFRKETTRVEFVDCARHIIFETYCRIHRNIEIHFLAEQLGLSDDDAERWVVQMIRKAHLDARIDSRARQVVMAVDDTDVYKRIIDRTTDLVARTQVLQRTLQSAVHEGRRVDTRGGRGPRGAKVPRA